MYLLIVKDGLTARYFGPYLTTKIASEDLPRVLDEFSSRAKWQINSLESPVMKSFDQLRAQRDAVVNAKAS